VADSDRNQAEETAVEDLDAPGAEPVVRDMGSEQALGRGEAETGIHPESELAAVVTEVVVVVEAEAGAEAGDVVGVGNREHSEEAGIRSVLGAVHTFPAIEHIQDLAAGLGMEVESTLGRDTVQPPDNLHMQAVVRSQGLDSIRSSAVDQRTADEVDVVDTVDDHIHSRTSENDVLVILPSLCRR